MVLKQILLQYTTSFHLFFPPIVLHYKCIDMNSLYTQKRLSSTTCCLYIKDHCIKYQRLSNPPDSATASTVTPCFWAMNPRTEKTTNPATKLVPLFSRQIQKQSLGRHRWTIDLSNFCFCLFFTELGG